MPGVTQQLGEGAALVGAATLELVPLLLVLGLFLWGRWVARRHGTRGWQLAAWLPVVGLVVQHAGLALTVFGLVHAFDAVAVAPPEARASELAGGIAQAMWATAIGLGLSGTIYVGCVVAFAVGTWRPAAHADA